MLNEKLPATKRFNMPAPSGGFVGGVPRLVGAMVVIPQTTANAGELTAVQADGGSFRLPKVAGAMLLGAVVDWNPDPGVVVAAGNVSGNFKLGRVVRAAMSADTHVDVSLTDDDVTAQAGG